MNRLAPCVVAIALSLAAAGEAPAGPITIPGDAGDGDVGITGLAGSLSDPAIRVGVAGNDQHGQATIFFFALPTVSSPAAITGAELQIQYLGISQFTVTVAPEFGADLFGVGARSTPTILGSDYYDGDASLSADTLIAEGFITPSTVPGSLQASGASLLAFIQSLYQPDGTPTAAYAVFRVNPDVHLPPDSAPYRGYELASADNTDGGGAFVPRLSLTAVPEPGTLTLAAGGALVLTAGGLRRRSRSRSNATKP